MERISAQSAPATRRHGPVALNVSRCFIIFSAVPIAVATYSLRVIVTCILAHWWGAKAAEGFFHEFAGMAVFVLAMVMLVLCGELLRRNGEPTHE